MAMSKSEENMLKIQHQLRDNQADVQDFLKNMDSWTDSMKKKDEDLKKGKLVEEPKLPPVRNSLLKKKKKKKEKPKEQFDNSGEKKKKISGYDFRAWDKLDVDKLCEEIDVEEEKKKAKNEDSSSEYETDEEWEMERKKQQASVEKDRGNQFFKEKDYVSAIECYTRGMELDPCNPLLPANRAMALLKQEKYAAAETDCLTALTLDPLYMKAYLRLGTARFGLKKFAESKEVFEKVLLMEPQNKQAKAELEKIEKELTKQKMVSQVQPTDDPDAGLVKPVTKPAHLRSQKPLKRIKIEEIGIEDNAERKSAIARVTESQSEVKRNITARDNEMFEHFITDQGHDSASNKSGKTATVIHSADNDQNGLSDIDKSVEKLKLTSTVNGETTCNGTDTSQPKHDSKGPMSPRNFTVPQTSFQFQTDYKSLKNNLEEFYRYLKRINPCNYPKLFGEALDAEILKNVLTVLKQYFIPDGENVYAHLLQLSDVKRFSMTVMFFSSKEQQVIKDLFSHMRNTGEVTSEELNKLAKKYQIS